MGGCAYRLDLVRPFVLDAIRLESGAGVEDRAGRFVGAGLRRSLRARRRARGTARPNPAVGDARRRRALRGGDRDRRAASRRFSSRIAPGAAGRDAFDGPDARRFSLRARRGGARDPSCERGRRDRRTRDDRRSDRGDIPVLGQHRVPRPSGLADRAHAKGAEFARRLSRAPRRSSRGDPRRLRPLGLGHEHSPHRQFAGGNPACAAHAPFRAANPAPA